MAHDLPALARGVLRDQPRFLELGRVLRLVGFLIEGHLGGVRVGALVRIERGSGFVLGEVIGFRDDLALIVPLSDVRGIERGASIWPLTGGVEIPVSVEMLGRVIDPLGHPIDGGPMFSAESTAPLAGPPPAVHQRRRVKEPFETGMRAIDGLLTCGRGQRVGLFAGAGVGKTMLIRQIAEQSTADVVVFGLIGERGCEVTDLLADGAHDRSVIVAATSDRSPMERIKGAQAATAVAEHFAREGANVLLIVDSLTRYAMALRETGLAAGEPPATKGYPPSVFAALPKLLERAAPFASGGSITAFYTVLVEGDDLSDPIADSARSLLDGHIVLSRELAARGQFPAIDLLASASRVALQVTPKECQDRVLEARRLLSLHREVEELKSLGAYAAGSNPEQEKAFEKGQRLLEWCRQKRNERSPFGDTMGGLARVIAR
jgi:flagellum-specific ATP synthase